MNERSRQKLSAVNAVLREKTAIIISTLELEFNCDVEVTAGFRTIEEQNKLYAQGRTTTGKIVTNAKGGQSFHNHGLAVDLCKFKNGQPVWDDEKFWRRLGELAKINGLVSGYFWKFQDKPHLQIGSALPKGK